MSRRQRDEDPLLSLDSFLDIVTNVVGVLILVAVVTVLGAGDVAISSGAGAMRAIEPSAPRTLFECRNGEMYFVDEDAHRERVVAEMERVHGGPPTTPGEVIATLESFDIGDGTHRVRARALAEGGIAWIYELRRGARGESKAAIEDPDSAFQRRLAAAGTGGFVYFVVDENSFELFRRARDLARARGVAVGWLPVAGKDPLELSVNGDLGRRIQ
jgi:hypothetical protein